MPVVRDKQIEVLFSASAIARMSAAVPTTNPDGSCSMSMAFSGMTTSSPAMAIMLAIEAAMPSIQTVTRASWRLSALWMVTPSNTEPPGLLIRTVSSAIGPSAFSSSRNALAGIPKAPISS